LNENQKCANLVVVSVKKKLPQFISFDETTGSKENGKKKKMEEETSS